MKWIAIVIVLVVASACGGPARSTRRSGPDVVTAEWTSGDDAPLGSE